MSREIHLPVERMLKIYRILVHPHDKIPPIGGYFYGILLAALIVDEKHITHASGLALRAADRK